MSSPKWSGKPKRFNPNRNFVMSDGTPTRKFNPKLTFSPSFASSAISPPTAPASLSQISAGSAFGVGGNGPLSQNGTSSLTSIGGPVSQEADSAGNTDALEFASLYHPSLHPLQYQMYAPSPYRLRMKPLEPHERSSDDFSLPLNLRKELEDRNEATLQILASSSLPEFVHVYHSLLPLDFGKGSKETKLWGHPAFRYKAISHTDGRAYCLLRVDNFEMTTENEHALQIINKWKRVQCASVVGVFEAFTTLAFAKMKGNSGDSKEKSSTSSGTTPQRCSQQSLVVVYEWHALSKPLASLPDPNEQVLWNLAAQIFSAVQAIHRRGLLCKGILDEHFVLLQGHDRVRLGSIGARDVLQPEAEGEQSDDYRQLGQMLQRLSRPVVTSSQFNGFVDALIAGNEERSSQLLTPQLFKAFDSAYQQIDHLEDSLALELQNGRLVRLLAKLEFVLNHKEALDPRDPNYILVLFRQYVFKQYFEGGKPSLNLAHALAALNKLDAGIDENVLLVSGDAKTRMIVSYKELKHMFSSAFEQMIKG